MPRYLARTRGSWTVSKWVPLTVIAVLPLGTGVRDFRAPPNCPKCGPLSAFPIGSGSEVKVTQSCLTLWDLTDYIVHGILQARILEWVAFPFSRGSSQPSGPGVSLTLGHPVGANCHVVMEEPSSPLLRRAQAQRGRNLMPGAQRPGPQPPLLLDDAPRGLEARDGGVLSVSVDNTRTGDIGTVNGQCNGGLARAQGGDRRDAHDDFSIPPASASGDLERVAQGCLPSAGLRPQLPNNPPDELAFAISHGHHDPAASIQSPSRDGEPRAPGGWAPTGTHTVESRRLWEKRS